MPENPTIDSKWGTPSRLHDPWILAHFKARPTDVLITTAPKAGTTWMQQILHQLRSGGDASFTSIEHVVPWLERPRENAHWRQMLEVYERIPDPRVFKTHCTYEQTPGADTVRIVLTSRDPRDCCVSFYHHMNDFTDEARARLELAKPESFDEYFERWMEFGSWFRNVRSWWPHRDAPNVLWLRYEDMKQDLAGSMRRIIAFLGWSLAPDAFQRALGHSSFQWMKQHSEKFTRDAESGQLMFRPGGFIRRGQVGDHRHVLSGEQQARILIKAQEMLTPDCLRFLGMDRWGL